VGPRIKYLSALCSDWHKIYGKDTANLNTFRDNMIMSRVNQNRRGRKETN
jgi:hypothetical protein